MGDDGNKVLQSCHIEREYIAGKNVPIYVILFSVSCITRLFIKCIKFEYKTIQKAIVNGLKEKISARRFMYKLFVISS